MMGEYYSDVVDDQEEALRWFEAAARQHPAYAFQLGRRFAEGDGLQADLEQAQYWWAQAARRDSGYAYELAEGYAKGGVLARDAQQALHWWMHGAELGDERCMLKLGNAYSSGTGTTANSDLSLQWWSKAAELKPNYAFELAMRYLNGKGLQREPEQAARWLVSAANAGHQAAIAKCEKMGLKHDHPLSDGK